MRRNDKSWMELDELLEPFLPAKSAETGTAVAVEFRNRLVKLEQQVMAQYTAMAAYATIAKQDVEAARAEVVDLDRSQATLIGLIEKLRNEVNTRLDGLERRTAGGDLPATPGRGWPPWSTSWRRRRPPCSNACRRTRNSALRSPN